MVQSELLSLLPSLLSLIVVVAVLIGLFTAIVQFIAKYGLIVIAGFIFMWFYDPIYIFAIQEMIVQNIASVFSS